MLNQGIKIQRFHQDRVGREVFPQRGEKEIKTLTLPPSKKKPKVKQNTKNINFKTYES